MSRAAAVLVARRAPRDHRVDQVRELGWDLMYPRERLALPGVMEDLEPRSATSGATRHAEEFLAAVEGHERDHGPTLSALHLAARTRHRRRIACERAARVLFLGASRTREWSRMPPSDRRRRRHRS